MKKIFKKKIGIRTFFILVLLLLSVGDRSGAMGADTVKIGHINPFSGPFEYAGRYMDAAFKFAVDEQNEKGGLLGKKIEIIREDSEMKPDVAIRKAKKLILEDKVNFILGGIGSHIGLALNKVATQYKTVTIYTNPVAVDITGKEFSRYAFRLTANSYMQGVSLAQLMATSPYRKYYLIGMDYAAGHAMAKEFEENIKAKLPDVQILGKEFFPLATKDFGPWVSKVMSAKPDVVYVGAWGPDLINFIRQARSMGLKSPFPFVTSYGFEPYVMNDLKNDAVGLHVTHVYFQDVNTPENKAMLAKYHEQHKNDKDFLTWWPFGDMGGGICATKMVFAGVEKAGSLDPEKIIEALEDFSYKTPAGLWKIRKCDHQVILPMFGGAVQAGWNPYYNGSIRPEVNFPWTGRGKDLITIPGEKVINPATHDYNPRCP